MPAQLSARTLFLGFAQVGLTAVGGAVSPLRYVLVVRRRWMSEGELAEGLAIAQALPGASAANLAVMVADTMGGRFGPLWALLGLCGPPLVVALTLATFATRLSATNVRFAAAETAVTAAVAGLFISNGIRLAWRLWRDNPKVARGWRGARLALSVSATTFVAGLHFWIPAVMVGVAATSFALETARRRVSER